MVKINEKASAGTEGKRDVLVTIAPNGSEGLDIEIESYVKTLFGTAIRKSVEEVLTELKVTSARVTVKDGGALDFVIRSRVQSAALKAGGIDDE